MAKFLLSACYTTVGTQGFRRTAAPAAARRFRKAIDGLGGSTEGFYFAFGERRRVCPSWTSPTTFPRLAL